MKPGRSPLDFPLQLEAAVSQGFCNYPETVGDPDELVWYHFFTGLSTYSQNRLASSEWSSPSNLVDIALRIGTDTSVALPLSKEALTPLDPPSTCQCPPQPRPRYLGVNEAQFEPTFSPHQAEYEMYTTQSAVPTPSESKWCEFHCLQTHNTTECRVARQNVSIFAYTCPTKMLQMFPART